VTGQHAEQEADDRVRHDEADALSQRRERLDEVVEPEARADLLHVSDALLLGRREDLADAKEADRHGHETDARQEIDLEAAQRLVLDADERDEALRSGDRVEADGGEQETEGEHRERLERRLSAEADERGE
jgi:hypothetical protein